MNEATNIRIDVDEDGFSLHVYEDEGEGVHFHHGFRITDPEAFYDHVRAAILPWLMERDAARAEYDRAKRQSDTRGLSAEDFSAYLDDAYGDNWAKRVGMEQMREQGYA